MRTPRLLTVLHIWKHFQNLETRPASLWGSHIPITGGNGVPQHCDIRSCMFHGVDRFKVIWWDGCPVRTDSRYRCVPSPKTLAISISVKYLNGADASTRCTICIRAIRVSYSALFIFSLMITPPPSTIA